MGQQQSVKEDANGNYGYGALQGNGTPSRRRAATDHHLRRDGPGVLLGVPGDLHRSVDDIAVEALRRRDRKSKLRHFVRHWEDDTRFAYLAWADGADDVYDSEAEEEETDHLLPTPIRKTTSYSEAGAGGVTIGRACVTFVKSMVGSYVLFTPRMFRNGGMAASVATMLVTSVVSTDNILMLLRAADAAGVHTFGAVGNAAFGQAGQAAVDISLVLSQLGYCVTYYVFVSGNLPGLFPVAEGSLAARLLTRNAVILFQVALFIPLSWIRRLKYMAVGMLMANLCMVVGLTLIIYVCIDTLAGDGPMPIRQFNPQSFILFTGAVVTCFEGIGLVLPIREGVTAEARRSFAPMIVMTMAAITLLYGGFAALGYATYGDTIESFITESMPADDPVANAAIVAYCLCITLTFPLQLFPAAKTIERYYFPSGAGKNSSTSKWKKNALRASLVCLTALVALKAGEKFDHFAGILGGVCAVPLALVYPVMFHLKLCGGEVSRLGWVYECCVGAVGVVGAVVVTITSIVTWQ